MLTAGISMKVRAVNTTEPSFISVSAAGSAVRPMRPTSSMVPNAMPRLVGVKYSKKTMSFGLGVGLFRYSSLPYTESSSMVAS